MFWIHRPARLNVAQAGERHTLASLGPHSLSWLKAFIGPPCVMGHHYDKQIDVEKKEKEEKNASRAVEKGRMEEAKVVRNRLMWVAFWSQGGIRAWDAAKNHAWVHGSPTSSVCVDLHDLYCHQRPQGCLNV